MKAETKYKGCIKLAAIGDALGWITEFEKNTNSLKSKYNTDFISSFHTWEKSVGGRFNGYTDRLEKGSYSDDTQLLLAVARSIKEDGSVDKNYFSKIELPSWLLYSRGAGRTVKNAARKIERKSVKWNSNFFTYKVGKDTVNYKDSGANGAAMRILPIALANFGDIEKTNEEIFANSIVTHGHPRAIIGAMLYGYAIDTILKFRPENFSYVAFLTEIGKDIHSKLSIPFISKPEFQSWVIEWNKGSIKSFREQFDSILIEAQNFLRDTYRFISNKLDDKTALEHFGCYKNETKGSGISTVIAGIYLMCKYFNEPIKAIVQAVNLIGTDTDSIAAFTGGLIGGLHGHSIIPERLKTVQDSHYLEEVAIRLLEVSESRAKAKKATYFPELNSLNNFDSDTFKVGEEIFFNPLGKGKIQGIERQKTLTKGKYNLIIDVSFDIGQNCRFAKFLSDSNLPQGIDLITNDIPDDRKSLNTIIPDYDYDTNKRIEKFIGSLDERQVREFKQILLQIKKTTRDDD